MSSVQPASRAFVINSDVDTAPSNLTVGLIIQQVSRFLFDIKNNSTIV